MQATTPVDPRVLDAMLPYFVDSYGNPHSRTHMYGWEAEEAIEGARADVAAAIGANPKEIIFTSGATESNNMAIKGAARFYEGRKKHVITTQTDHKCVLDSCRYLEQRGWGGDVPAREAQRVGGLGRAGSRHPSGHGHLFGHGGEQRDRRRAAPEADRRDLSQAQGLLPHRRRAVGKIPIDVNDMMIDCLSVSGP